MLAGKFCLFFCMSITLGRYLDVIKGICDHEINLWQFVYRLNFEWVQHFFFQVYLIDSCIEFGKKNSQLSLIVLIFFFFCIRSLFGVKSIFVLLVLLTIEQFSQRNCLNTNADFWVALKSNFIQYPPYIWSSHKLNGLNLTPLILSAMSGEGVGVSVSAHCYTFINFQW